MKRSDQKLILSPQAFWDFDPSKLNFKEFPVYTISRVLERGDDNDLIGLVRFYGDRVVEEVVNSTPELSYRARSTGQQLLSLHSVRNRRLKRVAGRLLAKTATPPASESASRRHKQNG